MTPSAAQQPPPSPKMGGSLDGAGDRRPAQRCLGQHSAVRQGRDLVTATYAHIGPEVADPAKRYAGNNLACVNCHLKAGTKKFGIPLFGLYWMFPQYSARRAARRSPSRTASIPA